MAAVKFCPRCATSLQTGAIGGRERPFCPAEGCGYVFFGDFSIGCGGVVIRDGKVLLVQRGHNPGKGSWQIPGGYVEADEPIVEAVIRECKEEAGVTAELIDVLGFRHSIGAPNNPAGASTNIYVVCRLRPIAGEPACDGDEIADAGYFTLEEVERMERVQSLSKWAIQRALETKGSGFIVAHDSADPDRPGWTLFGVPLPLGVEQVPLVLMRPPVPAAPPEAKPPAAT